MNVHECACACKCACEYLGLYLDGPSVMVELLLMYMPKAQPTPTAAPFFHFL